MAKAKAAGKKSTSKSTTKSTKTSASTGAPSARAKKAKSAGASERSMKKESQDIVDIIKNDHQPLKELIKIMKDTDKEMQERRKAFERFAPLLVAHARSEEEVVYEFMKTNEELREEGFEGDVEHGLADQMVEEAKRTDDEDQWSARVKVLAELVEHHITEEEDEILPDLKKQADASEREELGAHYLELKAKITTEGLDDITPEQFAEARQQTEASRSH